MKLRNVKKSFSKKIVKGWRNYLTLNIKYKDIGVENNFLNIKVLADMLELEITTDQIGIQGVYSFVNPTVIVEGIKMSTIVEINRYYVHNLDWTLNYFGLPEDTTFSIDNNYLYYMRITYGFKNPKCIFDEEYGYPKEEPYWLYEGDEFLEKTTSVITDSCDIKRDIVIEILNKFSNNVSFASNIFSGRSITNNLFKDLSELSSYCKTIYTDFEKDHVRLTYAIRYDEYIKYFLKDLKKLIKTHKSKL